MFGDLGHDTNWCLFALKTAGLSTFYEPFAFYKYVGSILKSRLEQNKHFHLLRIIYSNGK